MPKQVAVTMNIILCFERRMVRSPLIRGRHQVPTANVHAN